MNLDNAKAILSLLSNEALVSVSAFLLITLAFLSSAIFVIAKKTISTKIDSFLDKIDLFEKDINELKKSMLIHALKLENSRIGLEKDITRNKESIVMAFTDAREKTFSQINELALLSNQLQAKTSALSEIFDANVESLEIKLGAVIDTRKDIKDCYGKITIIENDVSKVKTSVVKIVNKMVDAGIIKKKVSGE